MNYASRNMSVVHRKLSCPECGNVCLSFKILCDHMEHYHGMWYLNKNAKLDSNISASHENVRIPALHNDHKRISSHFSNKNDNRTQGTHVTAAMHKLSQICSRLDDDVKLIFEELRRQNDFLVKKDSLYSGRKDIGTSPIPLYSRREKETPGSSFQISPSLTEPKAFNKVSHLSGMRVKDNIASEANSSFDDSIAPFQILTVPKHYYHKNTEKETPGSSFQISPSLTEPKTFSKLSPLSGVRVNDNIASVADSSYDDSIAPFQILTVPKQYHHKNTLCPLCTPDHVFNFDCDSNLISHLSLRSKLLDKFGHDSSHLHHSHTSVLAHETLNGDNCPTEESVLCKQLPSLQESRADSGKGESVMSKGTSAKVQSKHLGCQLSPGLEEDFNRKPSSGKLQQKNFVTDVNVENDNMNPLMLVFFYLNTNDLLTCKMVCRSWRKLAEQPCYYESVVISGRIVTSQLLQSIAESCHETKFLTLQDLWGRKKKSDETVAEYLKHLRGTLEIGLEAILRSAQYTLTNLNIVSCGNLLTERCLWLASCYSRELTEVAYMSQLHPATAESLWALGSGCRKVHTLIIPPLYPCPKPERFSSRCLYMVAKCWPNLRILCVGGTEVGTDGLISIASNCHSLQILELDHMGEVQDTAVVVICRSGLKALQKIYFTHTPVTPAALVHLYSVCSHLTVISVLLHPSDYFTHPSYPPNVQEFEKKISAIKDLLNKPGFSTVLRITVE